MASGTFATVINCIDGRAQSPVTNWMRANLHVNYVDAVTEPGPDKVVAQGTPEQIEVLRQKVLISVNAHHSAIVAIAAHYDCAGNPVSREDHLQMIRRSAEILLSWRAAPRIVGLWVNDRWEVEIICDSGSQGFIPDTFAAAITCVDGRTKQPLSDWLRQNYLVNYVDLITEPEPDRVLLEGPAAIVEHMRQSIEYSIREHNVQLLAVLAHYDCARNTISATDHQRRIAQCVDLIHSWQLPVRVLGLWLNDTWQIEVIVDSDTRLPTMKLSSNT